MSKWTPPNGLSDPRVVKRAKTIPDWIDIVDEHGKPFDPPYEPIDMRDGHHKLLIAFQAIRSKQSIETVFQRSMRAGLRKAIKKNPEHFAELL